MGVSFGAVVAPAGCDVAPVVASVTAGLNSEDLSSVVGAFVVVDDDEHSTDLSFVVAAFVAAEDSAVLSSVVAASYVVAVHSV